MVYNQGQLLSFIIEYWFNINNKAQVLLINKPYFKKIDFPRFYIIQKKKIKASARYGNFIPAASVTLCKHKNV